MAMTPLPGATTTRLQVPHQQSLFGDAPFHCGSITAAPIELDGRCSVTFQPRWVHGSERVFDQLRDEMPWRAMQRPMYDRVVAVPRLICTVDPSSLDRCHPLVSIATALQESLGMPLGPIGLNYYRTGQDSVAWHRDSIGRTRRPATVALVSLGSPRTLAMRPFRAPSEAPSEPHSTPATGRRWRLGGGDLLVMAGACQRDWEHAVPKERDVGPRISLAFRCKEALEGPRLTRAGVPPLWASRKLR